MFVFVKIINIISRLMNIVIFLMYEYFSVFVLNELFEFCFVFFLNSYIVLNFRYVKVMKKFLVDFGFFCIIII